jgi:hypothetical protein
VRQPAQAEHQSVKDIQSEKETQITLLMIHAPNNNVFAP